MDLRRHILAWTAVTLAVGSGCVTKSKHEALQRDFDTFRAESDARDKQHEASFAKLEEALKAEQDKLRLERERYAAEEGRLKGLIDGLNAEKVALAKDQSRMKATEAELQKALKELQERKAQVDARIAEYRNLIARFKGLIDAGKLRVVMNGGKMVVELATDILFPSGSATLSDDGRRAVIEVAQVLATLPDREFQVEGHTDNVPMRSAAFPSNWELAYGRANSVLYAMIEGGMAPNRISASSAGEFRPRADNGTKEGKAQNRRIEIIVVPDLSLLPGADELERMDSRG
jgi:chemotaxis protein MotB